MELPLKSNYCVWCSKWSLQVQILCPQEYMCGYHWSKKQRDWNHGTWSQAAWVSIVIFPSTRCGNLNNLLNFFDFRYYIDYHKNEMRYVYKALSPWPDHRSSGNISSNCYLLLECHHLTCRVYEVICRHYQFLGQNKQFYGSNCFAFCSKRRTSRMGWLRAMSWPSQEASSLCSSPFLWGTVWGKQRHLMWKMVIKQRGLSKHTHIFLLSFNYQLLST